MWVCGMCSFRTDPMHCNNEMIAFPEGAIKLTIDQITVPLISVPLACFSTGRTARCRTGCRYLGPDSSAAHPAAESGCVRWSRGERCYPEPGVRTEPGRLVRLQLRDEQRHPGRSARLPEEPGHARRGTGDAGLVLLHRTGRCRLHHQLHCRRERIPCRGCAHPIRPTVQPALSRPVPIDAPSKDPVEGTGG